MLCNMTNQIDYSNNDMSAALKERSNAHNERDIAITFREEPTQADLQKCKTVQAGGAAERCVL